MSPDSELEATSASVQAAALFPVDDGRQNPHGPGQTTHYGRGIQVPTAPIQKCYLADPVTLCQPMEHLGRQTGHLGNPPYLQFARLTSSERWEHF